MKSDHNLTGRYRKPREASQTHKWEEPARKKECAIIIQVMKCGFSKEDSKGSPCVDVITLVLISITMLYEDGHDDDVDDDVHDDETDDDDDDDDVSDDDDDDDDVGDDDDDDTNDGNENKSTQKKDFRAKKRTSKLKPCTYGVESGIEPGPHWWEARAQNTAPSLSLCN